MADAFSALDAAIGEVSKIRQLVTRKHSAQVYSPDEIDQLKSVAFAWFKNHRPVVIAHFPTVNLSTVDGPYQTVLNSTARRAARSTYSDALREARDQLSNTRNIVAITPAANVAAPVPTADAPPNFAPLSSDLKMQAILQARWLEVQNCLICRANLAATVMMGGLMESLLLARIVSSPDKAKVFTAKAAPKKAGVVLVLPDWKLVNMVDVAHELNWISKSAKDVGQVLRDFRNYIHPHKEYSDGVQISDEDARMFWEVTKSITRHVLNSVGMSP